MSNPGGLLPPPPGTTVTNSNDIINLRLRVENLERWIAVLGPRVNPPIPVMLEGTGGTTTGVTGGGGAGSEEGEPSQAAGQRFGPYPRSRVDDIMSGASSAKFTSELVGLMRTMPFFGTSGSGWNGVGDAVSGFQARWGFTFSLQERGKIWDGIDYCQMKPVANESPFQRTRRICAEFGGGLNSEAYGGKYGVMHLFHALDGILAMALYLGVGQTV